jgi:hypothetical protein
MYLLLFLISFCNCKESSDYARQISIEHIGISDKPVTSLFVATQKVVPPPKSTFLAIILSDQDFGDFEKCIVSFKPYNAPKSSFRYEFGTFRVTISGSRNKSETLIFSPEKAKLLFRGLKKLKINNNTASTQIRGYVIDNGCVF